MAMTLFGSVSEIITSSSTKPFCFPRIGRIFSSMVWHSSRALPCLLVVSTTLVNIESLLSRKKVERNVARFRAASSFLKLPPRYARHRRVSMYRNSCMRSNGALLGNFLILGGIAPEIFFPVALMVNGLCRPRRTWQRPLSPLDCRLDNSTDRPWHRRDNCPAKNTIKFSGALLRGDGGPALLDIR